MAIYTSNSTVHLLTELTTTIIGIYGVDGYRGNSLVKSSLFNEVLLIKHNTNIKYTLKREDKLKSTINSYGIPYKEEESIKWIIGSPSGNILVNYKFNLMICDGTWMQTGIMFTGDFGGNKSCENWQSDRTSWYFRHDGDYNPNNNSYHGVAFAENGHTNLTNKLVSILIK